MNQFDKDVEQGKQLLRIEGITFSRFKESFKTYFINPDIIDEDRFVNFYNIYAERRLKYKDTIEEWIGEFFQDFNQDDHDFWLKPEYNDKNK